MERMWRYITLLLACVALPAATNTPPCDPMLAPLTTTDGYLVRANGQRCEGLFISPVAGSPVELVSLTRGKLAYDLTKPGELAVRLASTRDLGDGNISLRAMGIPLGLYYRMDAPLSADKPFSWPTKDVLVKDKLTPQQIGIFAFSPRPHGDFAYRPVQVSGPGVDVAPDAKINAVLRPLTMLDGVKFRFLSGGKTLMDWTAPPRSGDRFVVELPAQLTEQGTLELSWIERSLGIVRSKQFVIVY